MIPPVYYVNIADCLFENCDFDRSSQINFENFKIRQRRVVNSRKRVKSTRGRIEGSEIAWGTKHDKKLLKEILLYSSIGM